MAPIANLSRELRLNSILGGCRHVETKGRAVERLERALECLLQGHKSGTDEVNLSLPAIYLI